MTKTINSTRTYAALRAHRTQLAARLATVINPVARKGMEAALELYDRELANAPVSEKPTKAPADRKLAAIRAHRTMLANKVKGTRGKARAAIQDKIAAYDALLAA
jgi:LmbE family N-acetylglucosaminyl deacetylase